MKTINIINRIYKLGLAFLFISLLYYSNQLPYYKNVLLTATILLTLIKVTQMNFCIPSEKTDWTIHFIELTGLVNKFDNNNIKSYSLLDYASLLKKQQNERIKGMEFLTYVIKNTTIICFIISIPLLINPYPGCDLMILTISGIIAFQFIWIAFFEIPHESYSWDLVFPQLTYKEYTGQKKIYYISQNISAAIGLICLWFPLCIFITPKHSLLFLIGMCFIGLAFIFQALDDSKRILE